MRPSDVDPADAARPDLLAEVRRRPDGIGARTLVNLMHGRGQHSREALRNAIMDALDDNEIGLNSQLRLVVRGAADAP